MILDDPVMHHRQSLGHMRVSVMLDRLAMGCPARMRNADMAMGGRSIQCAFKFGYLACCPDPFDAVAAGQYSHTRRIVSAVLKPAKAFNQDGSDIASGNCANYSAHADSS